MTTEAARTQLRSLLNMRMVDLYLAQGDELRAGLPLSEAHMTNEQVAERSNAELREGMTFTEIRDGSVPAYPTVRDVLREARLFSEFDSDFSHGFEELLADPKAAEATQRTVKRESGEHVDIGDEHEGINRSILQARRYGQLMDSLEAMAREGELTAVEQQQARRLLPVAQETISQISAAMQTPPPLTEAGISYDSMDWDESLNAMNVGYALALIGTEAQKAAALAEVRGRPPGS